MLLLKGQPLDSILKQKSHFSGADLLTGLSHICGHAINPVQFPFSVMLKVSPMPLGPVKIPLAMIRIRILLVLLLRFNSNTCLLPVSQPVHPGEMIPTKLFHGPELVRIVQSLPITVRILISNFAQKKRSTNMAVTNGFAHGGTC